MLLVMIVCLAIIIAIVVYQLIHREIAKHATLIVRNDAQATTDRAMKEAVLALGRAHLVPNSVAHFDHSQTVADVWGKGVMAFEYVLVGEQLTQVDLAQLRATLNQSLAEYAETHQIERVAEARDTFLVTDAWVYEQRLHLDVAYVVNEATYQYIYDLKKLT